MTGRLTTWKNESKVGWENVGNNVQLSAAIVHWHILIDIIDVPRFGPTAKMPSVFQKLLIGNAMMLIWYLLYRMILVRSTHYQLNRVYLISGLIIPVILLLLDINPLVRKFQRLDTAIARMADQTALIKGYGQIINTENQRFFLYIYTCGLIIFSAQLLMQALSLNPVTFMLRNAVQQNLEYLTDREVLRLGINRREYQYSLLRLSMKKTSTEIKNFYTGTDLKTRITEMNLPEHSFMNKAWNGIAHAVAIACLCLVNTFQLHVAGHHAFYQQMIDPEFLQLQARAESHQLKDASGHPKLEPRSLRSNLKQEK